MLVQSMAIFKLPELMIAGKLTVKKMEVEHFLYMILANQCFQWGMKKFIKKLFIRSPTIDCKNYPRHNYCVFFRNYNILQYGFFFRARDINFTQ